MLANLLIASLLTFVELNCENLFDCNHDSLKNDTEYLPEATRHWNKRKYWRKLDAIGRAIVSCCDDSTGFGIPDIVVLCEVENDTVMRDLTRRSLLRNLHYDYFMTNSPDPRGIDVAIMFHKFSFAPISHASLAVKPAGGHVMRDILHVAGRTAHGDTLHLLAVHAPSRYGGEAYSRPFRLAMARRLCEVVDSVSAAQPGAKIIVAGDFNDYVGDAPHSLITSGGLVDVSATATGSHGAQGTYCYQGWWGSLDHIFFNDNMLPLFHSSYVNDAPFLLEKDAKHGGLKPHRTYNGMRYQPGGTSDHLPLVVRFWSGKAKP